MAPAQSCSTEGESDLYISYDMPTLRDTCPSSQALATAYTYERLAFSLVYMSAIFAIMGLAVSGWGIES